MAEKQQSGGEESRAERKKIEHHTNSDELSYIILQYADGNVDDEFLIQWVKDRTV